MRYTAPNIQARRAARSGLDAHALVWVSARNRSTGETETMGLWTGDDHREFVIGAQTRTYYGAGNILEIPAIRCEIGLDVRRISIGLSAVSDEVQMLLRGYDPKGAPVQIHRAEFNENGNLIAAPERLFDGWVDGSPIMTPAIGGMASASLDCVSNSRILTRFGSATKSDQMQRQRDGDRFRRYASLVKDATIYWGEANPQAATVRTTQPPLREPNWGGDR